MATLVSLFNSDVKAFVGTRVGFAFLSILTALAASNDITPVNASAQQLTVVDTLSAFTVLFGMYRLNDSFSPGIVLRAGNAYLPSRASHVYIHDWG